MRLFAALSIPAVLAEQFTRFRLRVSSPKDGLRWSGPEQWHVTVQFYEDVSAEQASCILQQLHGSPLASARVAVSGLGMFAAKGILFAGIEETDPLHALHAEVQQRSRLSGVAIEARPFRPHITLARSKGKAGYATLQRLSTPLLPSLGPRVQWFPDELVLLESILRPQGAEYVVQARVALHHAPAIPCEEV